MSNSSEDDFFASKENKNDAFSPVRKQTSNIKISNDQNHKSYYPLKAKKFDFYNARKNSSDSDDFFSPTTKPNNFQQIYAPERQLIREALLRDEIYKSPPQPSKDRV